MQKLSKEDIAVLWNKMLQNEATADELRTVLDYIESSGIADEVSDEISTGIGLELPGSKGFVAMDEEQKMRLLQKVFAKEEDEKVREIPRVHRIPGLKKWIWAAAAVLLIASIGAVYWFNQSTDITNMPVAEKEIDITPGKQGAVLILSDGSQVVLDSLGNGVVASQNGSRAVIRNGELLYDVTGNISQEVAYNTMRTPKGRQFTLLLPDGTRVWLNAASSIRYPTAFTGKEREVQMTGEVYFEVAKNKQMPFRVNAGNHVEVEVLGTGFNVNAYENEAGIAATLLEGSVRVKRINSTLPDSNKSDQGTILKPGQQLQFTGKGGMKQNNNADIEKVMAWKNGLFNFKGATLEEVMRQLERWYDIEVVYAGKIPQKQFWGEMGMDLQLEDILQFLEKSDIKFSRQGRQLMVAP